MPMAGPGRAVSAAFAFDICARICLNGGMIDSRQRLHAALYRTTYGAVLLVALGLYFLLQNFGLIPNNLNIGQLWPLLLIIPGIMFLVANSKKPRQNQK